MKKSLFILAGLFMFSCAGVKFANAPVNADIPDSFKKRALYPAGVAAYDFQDFVGNILIIKENEDPLRIGIIRPASFTPIVIPIDDPNNYYKSRVQKGAEVKGAYLAFAANFSTEQLAELELVDIARAGISFDDQNNFQEVVEKAKIWVHDHPKTELSIKRLWVKSAVVTRRLYNDFIKIDANASGQVGDVVGVSTGVYNKSSTTIKSVILSFEAFDIDELVDQSSAIAQAKSLGSIENKLDNSLFYKGSIKGKIKDFNE
jgi:hypothetical protein